MVAASTLQRFPRSKIELPQSSSSLIVRDRLFPLLDSQANVLVVAPAGSGKSSLLATWAHTRRDEPAAGADPSHIFAWYSIDQADREPARFVDGLAAALEAAAPGRGLPARTLLDTGAGTYGALAALLAELEDLAGATVILDNCHHIEGARAAENVLEHLTRHRPEHLRLIYASRGIPLLPALSAIATGKLRTIGRNDLQFSTEEAHQLLVRHGLEHTDSERLVRSTGGWAMGLLLQAHAGAGNISFIQRPLDAVAEYLMTQVVDQLDPHMRTFVVESALLGAFDETSSNAILERADCGELIDGLARHGLFLDTYASETGTMVRYHDLFAEALSDSLRRSAPDRFTAIQLRAAIFHRDDPHLGLAHAAQARDAGFLAAEVVRALPQLRRLGHWEAIIQYGEKLPLPERPLMLMRMLSYAYYVRGDDISAVAAANSALARATAENDHESRYSALVLRANSMLRQDRGAEILKFCLPALAEARITGPKHAEGWLAAIVAGCHIREGHLIEGKRMAQDVRALLREHGGAGGPLAIAWFDQDFAALLLAVGEIRQAEQLLTAAAAIAADQHEQSLITYCDATRSEALLYRGEAGAAFQLAERIGDAALREGNVIARYTALRVQARALAQLGRPHEAVEALEHYAGVVANWPAPVRVTAELTRAYVSLFAGDFGHARQALDTAASLGVSARAAGLLALEAGTLALAEGRHRDAEQWLTDATTSLKQYALRPALARALVLKAHALACVGRERPAIECLVEAATLPAHETWAAGLQADAGLALESLRSLGTHWRLQGKGRELVESLVKLPTQSIRLVRPARAPAATGGTRKREASARANAATQVAPLQFSPFGEGYLVEGSTVLPLARLGGDKARELLAFAIYQARPLQRDEILEALWDGAEDVAVLAAFRKCTYQIRRVLGHDAWQRVDSAYRITTPVDDDYRRLLTLAVSADEPDATPADVTDLAARGLKLYSGPYLAWCYSEWTDAPRSMAKTAMVSILTALTTARQRLGQPTAALEAAERGLGIEPTCEPLRLAQIRVLVELGRSGEALESYSRHLQLLVDEELGAPSAELRGLVRSIRA